jgi:hypothetical protein
MFIIKKEADKITITRTRILLRSISTFSSLLLLCFGYFVGYKDGDYKLLAACALFAIGIFLYAFLQGKKNAKKIIFDLSQKKIFATNEKKENLTLPLKNTEMFIQGVMEMNMDTAGLTLNTYYINILLRDTESGNLYNILHNIGYKEIRKCLQYFRQLDQEKIITIKSGKIFTKETPKLIHVMKWLSLTLAITMPSAILAGSLSKNSPYITSPKVPYHHAINWLLDNIPSINIVTMLLAVLMPIIFFAYVFGNIFFNKNLTLKELFMSGGVQTKSKKIEHSLSKNETYSVKKEVNSYSDNKTLSFLFYYFGALILPIITVFIIPDIANIKILRGLLKLWHLSIILGIFFMMSVLIYSKKSGYFAQGRPWMHMLEKKKFKQKYGKHFSIYDPFLIFSGISFIFIMPFLSNLLGTHYEYLNYDTVMIIGAITGVILMFFFLYLSDRKSKKIPSKILEFINNNIPDTSLTIKDIQNFPGIAILEHYGTLTEKSVYGLQNMRLQINGKYRGMKCNITIGTFSNEDSNKIFSRETATIETLRNQDGEVFIQEKNIQWDNISGNSTDEIFQKRFIVNQTKEMRIPQNLKEKISMYPRDVFLHITDDKYIFVIQNCHIKPFYTLEGMILFLDTLFEWIV